eukprot:scaffold10907_cov119-Isochrysis_galbana.AAC.2
MHCEWARMPVVFRLSGRPGVFWRAWLSVVLALGTRGGCQCSTGFWAAAGPEPMSSFDCLCLAPESTLRHLWTSQNLRRRSVAPSRTKPPCSISETWRPTDAESGASFPRGRGPAGGQEG